MCVCGRNNAIKTALGRGGIGLNPTSEETE